LQLRLIADEDWRDFDLALARHWDAALGESNAAR